jgi:hypothetical protein
MAFGAALTAAGGIGPAVQQAQDEDIARRRAALEFRSQQRAADTSNQAQIASTARTRQLTESERQKTEQDKKQWIPVRSYQTATGEKHTVYLTDSGYKDEIDSPGNKTFKQYMDEAAPFFGGADKVPDWYKNQALASSEGLPYKQPTTQEKLVSTVVPDENSLTGFSKEQSDALTGKEVSKVPTVPPWSYTTIKTDASHTDPTGLTTKTSSLRTPVLPNGQPVRSSTAASSRPGVAASGGATTSPRASSHQLDSTGHIPAQSGLPEAVRAAANQIIDTGDERQVQASPAIKSLARMWVQKYKGTSPNMPQGARKVTQLVEPVIAQTDRIMDQIKKLGLDNNNQAGYLLRQRAEYMAGRAAPAGTLGASIADLSLGSVLEATSALSGSSRSYNALKKALEHTPNPWVDSPQLMYQKLTEIRQRLADMDEEARTGGMRALGTTGGAQASPAAPSAAPRAGEVVDGYKFKGGDPSQQSNWVKQ